MKGYIMRFRVCIRILAANSFTSSELSKALLHKRCGSEMNKFRAGCDLSINLYPASESVLKLGQVKKLCCGSVKFWQGSGSGNPCL